ncbi:hypothetical protein ABL78_5321 [Leptomonas seymouri]|uniref:Uncharacterized protein n=1 Tax=Leptomonas seymouri TaxID=5684 RepID=A0A0N1IJD8_LEPSE|nr:hypothetical protein ABL78_5321 [Leptomonas seymouri]|eukprot:KPI85611.1 hypothetical protein ABL78_5321 [Leptomonas seymouri]
MGSCCIKPSSAEDYFGVVDRASSGGQNRASPSRSVAAASEKRKHKAPRAIDTPCLAFQDCSRSKGSSMGIGTEKVFEQVYVAQLSCENRSPKRQVVPSSCLDAPQASRLAHPPCTNDGSEGSGKVRSCGIGAMVPINAAPSTPNMSVRTATATTAKPVSLRGSAAAALRRSPKHALLSYAEQYRALQPFLHETLRNRRWRLAFSSDVHGTQLIDACKRAFLEEEAQWRAFEAARLHLSVGGPNTVEDTANHEGPAAVEVPCGGSSVLPSAKIFVPVLALMETSITVPAPLTGRTAASSAALHGVTSAPDGGEALAVDHGHRRSSVVVDSHVCIGLYLQRRPMPGAITSYRRSEVFFFLFLSAIERASTAEAASMGSAGPQEHPTQPVAAVPRPPAMQVGGDEVPSDADREDGGARSSSGRRSSNGTLAYSSVRQERTAQAETHRPRSTSGECSSSEMDKDGAADAATARGGGEGAAGPTFPPPQVSATCTTRAHLHNAKGTTNPTRSVDRHDTGVEAKRSSAFTDAAGGQQDGASENKIHSVPTMPIASALGPPGLQQRPAPPRTPNGSSLPQWRYHAEEIAQHAQQTYPEECDEGKRTCASPGCSHLVRKGEAAEDGSVSEDTFSSASAAPRSGELDSAERTQCRMTREPPTLASSSLLNSNTGGHHARSLFSGAKAPPVCTNSLPAWAAEAVSSVGSPRAPVAPHRTLDPSAAVSTPVFAISPLSMPRASAYSPSAFELHSSHTYEAGYSFALEDDLVSASTTVVSDTSVPGGGLTWREDEDLSSYWPEARQTSDKNSGTHTAFWSPRHGGCGGQEWHSPGSGPQLRLSRVSSLGGEDTAECFTPRVPRERAPGRAATTAFSVLDGVERQPSELIGGRTPPLLPHLNSGGGGGTELPSSPSENQWASVSMNSSPVALNASMAFSAFNAATATAAGGASMTMSSEKDSPGCACSALRCVRPHSTSVEVLPMTPFYEAHADGGAGASSSDVPLHLETPSSSESPPATTEGTIDVYFTSAGAIDVWDSRKGRTPKVPAADVDATGDSENVFVCHRDASGIRWNLPYFWSNDHGMGPASGTTCASLAGATGHSSLFSFIAAQARQGNGATGADAAAGSPSAEILTASLVKTQVCVISSRMMPAAFQRPPPSAAAAPDP